MTFIDGISLLFGSAVDQYPFLTLFIASMLFLACSFNLFALIGSILNRVGGFR